jgi:hypothetical protein
MVSRTVRAGIKVGKRGEAKPVRDGRKTERGGRGDLRCRIGDGALVTDLEIRLGGRRRHDVLKTNPRTFLSRRVKTLGLFIVHKLES